MSTGEQGGSLQGLHAALQSRPLVICAGPRIGHGPTNAELFADILRALPEGGADAVARGVDSWLVGDYLAQRLGERLADNLRDMVEETPLCAAYRVAAQLQIRGVLTTSYGDEWERSFAEVGVDVSSYSPGDEELLQASGQFVFHVFGQAQRAGSLLAGSQGIRRAYQNTSLRSWLKSVWDRAVVLLIGFSPTDPELRLLLEHVLPGKSMTNHFALLPGATFLDGAALSESYGINVLDEESLLDVLNTTASAARSHWYAPLWGGNDDLHTLLEMAADAPDDSEILARFELLEAHLRKLGEHEQLVDLKLGKLTLTESPADRQALLIDIARTFADEMSDWTRAFHAAAAAYRELPSVDLWPTLESFASSSGLWSDYAIALLECADRLSNEDYARASIKACHLFEHKLGKPGTALETAAAALTRCPEHHELCALHRGLLRKLGHWNDLVRALESASERATDNLSRAGHYYEHGEILREQFGNSDAAEELFRRALAIAPAHRDARRALVDLMVRREDTRGLVALMQERLEVCPDDSRVDTLRRLAELSERIGDYSQAAFYYDAVRSEQPTDIAVLHALERLYKRLEMETAYLEVLRDQLGVIRTGAERLEVHKKMAAAYEEIGLLDDAEASWEWVLAEDADNEVAFAALERLYQMDRRWELMLELYGRRARATDPEQSVQLLLQMSDIQSSKLGDPGRAIDLVGEALKLIPDHAPAITTLIDLYQQQGHSDRAAEMLEEQARRTKEPDERVDALYRAAALWVEDGNSDDAAIQCLSRALDSDAHHINSLELLATLRAKQGEHRAAADLYSRASVRAAGTRKSDLMTRVASALSAAGEQVRAAIIYEDVLKADPTHQAAMNALAELYRQTNRPGKAIPLLEKLLVSADTAKRASLHTHLAEALAACGELEKSIASYRSAIELRPDDVDLHHRLTCALIDQRNWADAEEACSAFARLGEGRPDLAVQRHYLTALCARGRGDRNAARHAIAMAREIDPLHRPSLVLLAELSDDSPEAMLAAKRTLLGNGTDEERATLLIEIGDIYMHRLNALTEAKESYEAARALRPDDHLILHRCVDLALEQKDWNTSLELLESIIATESVPTVRARYRHTAAKLLSHELGDETAAIAMWWKAVDDDPRDRRPLHALAKRLRAQQNWKGLVDCYSKLLAVERESPALEATEHAAMWHELSDICQRKLGDRQTAICALEVAVRLEPDNLDFREQLAAALAQSEDSLAAAAAQHQKILERDKSRQNSYKVLAEIYKRLGEPERADRCRSAVRALQGTRRSSQSTAEPAIRGIPAGLVPALRHPEEDLLVSQLLSWIAPAAVAIDQDALRRRQLPGSAVCDRDGKWLVRRVKKLAEMLVVPCPVVHVDAAQSAPVDVSVRASGAELVPILVVSQAVIDQKITGPALDFQLGRALSRFRRDHILAIVTPSAAGLGRLIGSALGIGCEPGDTGERNELCQLIESILSPMALTEARKIARALRQRTSDPVQLARSWQRACDYTHARAGLLVSGDLFTSLSIIQSESPTPGTRGTTPIERELIWSSCTDDFMTLWRAMRTSSQGSRRHRRRQARAAAVRDGQAGPHDTSNASATQSLN